MKNLLATIIADLIFDLAKDIDFHAVLEALKQCLSPWR